MLITHKRLPRRTFLKGMGAAIALPMLDAMTPALGAFGPEADQLRQFAGELVRRGR